MRKLFSHCQELDEKECSLSFGKQATSFVSVSKLLKNNILPSLGFGIQAENVCIYSKYITKTDSGREYQKHWQYLYIILMGECLEAGTDQFHIALAFLRKWSLHMTVLEKGKRRNNKKIR